MKKLRMTVVDSAGNFDQGIGSIEARMLEWSSFGNFGDGRVVEYKWKTAFSNDGNTHVHTGFVTVDGLQGNFSDTLKWVAISIGACNLVLRGALKINKIAI